VGLIALITWIITASGGLYLLAIWLIEYDKDFHAVAATRLPPPVLAAHVSLAGGGLVVWISYLFYDYDDLGWISAGAVCAAAVLGLVMAVRWASVYRAKQADLRQDRLPVATHATGVTVLERPAAQREGPPERNFPLPVVIAHGTFAAATITLVLLSVFAGS
jgi:hypothetical protein